MEKKTVQTKHFEWMITYANAQTTPNYTSKLGP